MEVKSFLEVLPLILPRDLPKVTSEDENAIEQRHIMIYGGAGSGKTNAFKHLSECLEAIYYPTPIYTAWTDADLSGLIDSISPEHQIQLLCCEDMTRIRQPEDAIHKYFTIRHILAEKTGRREGLIITAFTTHDLFGIQPKSLRTNVDLTIFLETPSNIYDERIAKEILGEELYNQLKQLERQKGIVAYATKWEKGLAYIPKAKAKQSLNKRYTSYTSNNNSILKRILKEIWRGANTEKLLSCAFPTLHPNAIKEALNKLAEEGLIMEGGLIFKKWYLTLKGASMVE